MRRPDRPPDYDFFDRRRPRSGDAAIAIVLGPIRIELDGLSGEIAGELTGRYGPYLQPPRGAGPALRLRVELAADDYFIPPAVRRENVLVLLACDGDRVRYLSYRVAGWFDVEPGRGSIVLSRGSFEPTHRALENFIRAAVAWQAAARGGALLHAASAIRNDRAYVFYGESGAGKSTLAACNVRGRVVSDDLTLVVPGEGGALEVVGSPFRGTYEQGEPVAGCYPLAAGFRLVQDDQPAVREVPRVVAMAELVGNLPFVAEAFHTRPDLLDTLARNLTAIPLAHLHFRKDDSFWDAIATAGL